MHPFTLPENTKIHGALKPAADAAGRAGRYVSLKNVHKMYVVVYIDQGNAATVALTITQAQDISGTGAKALAVTVPIWANQDVANGDTLARQTDAVSFTTSAAVAEKCVVFEVQENALDLANGFKTIRVNTGASNVANITSAVYVGAPLRYPGNASPSIITN